MKTGLWTLMRSGGFACKSKGEDAIACFVTDHVYRDLQQNKISNSENDGVDIRIHLGDTVVVTRRDGIPHASICPPGVDASIYLTDEKGAAINLTGLEMFLAKSRLNNDVYKDVSGKIDAIFDLALASSEGSRFSHHLVGQAVISKFIPDISNFDMSISLSDLGRHVRFQMLRSEIYDKPETQWADFDISDVLVALKPLTSFPDQSATLKSHPVYDANKLKDITQSFAGSIYVSSGQHGPVSDCLLSGDWVEGLKQQTGCTGFYAGTGFDRIEFKKGTLSSQETISLSWPTKDRIIFGSKLSSPHPTIRISQEEIPSSAFLKEMRVLRDNLYGFSRQKPGVQAGSEKTQPSF